MRSLIIVLLIFFTVLFTAAYAEVGVHSMFDGTKMIEVYDTRQLTTRDDGRIERISMSPDGKYILYVTSRDGMFRLCVTTPEGGKPTILLDTWQYQREIGKDEEITRIAGITSISWSPDSRSITVPVTITKDLDTDSITGILVLNRSGARLGFFSLPKNSYIRGRIVWSPNSRKIAIVLASTVVENNKPKSVNQFSVFNLTAGGGQASVPCPENFSDLSGWSPDGKGLICTMRNEEKPLSFSKVEYPLDGSPAQVIEKKIDQTILSPDRNYELLSDKPGISFLNRATGKTVDVVKAPVVGFCRWSPDGKMIAYYRSYSDMPDDAGKRICRTATLWLATPFSGKYNDMQVCSLDNDSSGELEWSPDGSVLAYISQGYLHTVKLIARDPNLGDKLAMGIPLTESEMQQALLSNVKQIGTGLMMYTQDWDGKSPGADSFQDDLAPYLKNNGVFNIPGGLENAFEFFPVDNMNTLSDPANTILGRMDAGYGWYAVVYADGHAKIVQK